MSLQFRWGLYSDILSLHIPQFRKQTLEIDQTQERNANDNYQGVTRTAEILLPKHYLYADDDADGNDHDKNATSNKDRGDYDGRL